MLEKAAAPRTPPSAAPGRPQAATRHSISPKKNQDAPASRNEGGDSHHGSDGLGTGDEADERHEKHGSTSAADRRNDPGDETRGGEEKIIHHVELALRRAGSDKEIRGNVVREPTD
ncbi:hypothetical protein Q1M64_15465 (plasmid) [Sinorhizobium meliloti]|nr:hypothetical protein Q1M64_15465 [Sinorhizobium meliloti]